MMRRGWNRILRSLYFSLLDLRLYMILLSLVSKALHTYSRKILMLNYNVDEIDEYISHHKYCTFLKSSNPLHLIYLNTLKRWGIFLRSSGFDFQVYQTPKGRKIVFDSKNNITVHFGSLKDWSYLANLTENYLNRLYNESSC